MAKLGNNLELEIPREVAEQLRWTPGEEVELNVVGRELRVMPAEKTELTAEERVALFDESIRRQEQRERERPVPPGTPTDRGWTREQLHEEELAKRGSSR
jgi:antitoxin component of MazEF toxin-antitoxin module